MTTTRVPHAQAKGPESAPTREDTPRESLGVAQRALQTIADAIDRSPRMMAQRRRIAAAFGPAAQIQQPQERVKPTLQAKGVAIDGHGIHAAQMKYGALPKDITKKAKAIFGKEKATADDLKGMKANLEFIDDWVDEKDDKTWDAFTKDKDAVGLGLGLRAAGIKAKDLVSDVKFGSNYIDAANGRLKAIAANKTAKDKQAAAADAKEKPQTTRNTLTTIENYWAGQGLEVGGSKSGSGMLLLLGLSYDIGKQKCKAHLSLPPDASGFGYFSEGHLKIEEGDLLNQYFFSVSESGTVQQIGNSKVVPTQKPGVWNHLPAEVWSDVKSNVEHLAAGKLDEKS